MMRHFTVLTVAQHDAPTLKTVSFLFVICYASHTFENSYIFGSIMESFASRLPNPMRDLGSSIVDASVAMLTATAEAFLPTPTKSHYSFHIRDLIRLFSVLLCDRVNRIYTLILCIFSYLTTKIFPLKN